MPKPLQSKGNWSAQPDGKGSSEHLLQVSGLGFRVPGRVRVEGLGFRVKGEVYTSPLQGKVRFAGYMWELPRENVPEPHSFRVQGVVRFRVIGSTAWDLLPKP